MHDFFPGEITAASDVKSIATQTTLEAQVCCRLYGERLKEEDARQRGSGGRGTRHLKIASAREDHAALHNVISDDSP